MNPGDNILDTSWLRLVGDFDNQVDYLLNVVRLRRPEVDFLSNLFTDLEMTLQTAWPGCKVMPFGSIVTGLGIRTSDVDCYISLPSWVNSQHAKLVMKAKQVLSQHRYIFTDLFAIPMAKVPIVKFFHIPTGRHCDVSFKSPAGVQNTKLIAYLLHEDSRLLPLAILIKYWSKVHNLTGTNLLPNYALTMLLIFYLQQVKILPPVYLLQEHIPNQFIDNWNSAFSEIFSHMPDNDNSLYQLLGGFFEYYSKFDFETNVVSPYLGCTLKRDVFKIVKNVPEEFALYKQNLKNGMCPKLKIDTKFCIQDPFDHSRNCAVAVYPKLAQKLAHYFWTTAKMFANEPRSRFLRAMLMKMPDSIRPVTTVPVWKGPVARFTNVHVGKVVKRKKHNKKTKPGMSVFEMYNEIRRVKQGR